MTVQHGGDIFGYEGIGLDFSVNTNPLGMPEEVRACVHASRNMWERYPDCLYRTLRKKMAEVLLSSGTELSEECFLFGNGASDLLFSAVFALRPGKALLAAPCFSEYGRALSAAGCAVEYVYLQEEKGFSLKEEETRLFSLLRGKKPSIMIIGNPNNPTGDAVSGVWIKMLADVCRECGTFLIVDECFNWFLEKRETYSLMPFLERDPKRFGHVMILNAFTKIFSMAGLRFGFAVCADLESVRLIESVRQPWGVSAPAQAGAEAALSRMDFVDETAGFVKAEREYMSRELERAGFKVYPSMTNYILFRRAEDDLADYRMRCLREGMLIRSCGNFEGLDERFYRTSVRLREENRRLLNCLGRKYDASVFNPEDSRVCGGDQFGVREGLR